MGSVFLTSCLVRGLSPGSLIETYLMGRSRRRGRCKKPARASRLLVLVPVAVHSFETVLMHQAAMATVVCSARTWAGVR
jgi:hypothetical protein